MNLKSAGSQSLTRQLNASHLKGQFIIGKNRTRVPEGWSSEKIGAWFLGRHPSLPRIRVLDDDDCVVGWLLGYPIDGKGVLLSEGDVIRVSGLYDCSESSVEQFVYGFGGRFLVALVGVLHPRLYLDPCGLLSVVYCAHQQVVASTPSLIPYDDQTQDRVDLAREMGIPYSNAMYPLGLTPRYNIERLLPNHYLDFSKWKSVRHWPKRPLQNRESVDEAVGAIAAIVKRNIAAVALKIPTYLHLTGGHDSRMLLACAKDVVDHLEMLTIPFPDDRGFIDVSIARKITRQLHLRHFVPHWRKPKQEDLDKWMFRVGYSVGEARGMQAATTLKQVNPAYAHLYGEAGEVGRAYLARELSASEGSKITPELLHSCWGVLSTRAPNTALTLAPIRHWLETVPAADAIQLLDLFLIEQRLGCWGGIWPYAESGDTGFITFPICHREIIERMLTLPTQYRRSGALARDVINREWPELLAWPFNEPIGFMHVSLAAYRTRALVSKAMRNPPWAMKRIWERLSSSPEK
jgi:hypothetical protein